MSRYNEVILAALLHDIGKFYGRSKAIKIESKALKDESELSTSHPIISAFFVEGLKEQIAKLGLDFHTVKTLVQRHHEYTGMPKDCLVQEINDEKLRSLAVMVSRADSYSSSEREETETKGQTYATSLMDSIFCRIDIGRGQPAKGFKIKPQELDDPEKAFPIPEAELKGNYNFEELIRNFGETAKEIKFNDYDEFYHQLLALIKRFCWAIPADIREVVKDVSLYDHLSTSSAIAAALYKYHEQDLTEKAIKDTEIEKFMLIGGDLSGIQKYLYQISNIGVGSVAKRLRARSFRISMLMEATSLLICNELDLPVTSIIISTGGRFIMLAPNDNKTKKKLETLIAEIEIWLLNKYKGELSINFATQSFASKSFEREAFKDVLTTLNFAMEEKKLNKFSLILNHDNFVFRKDKRQKEIMLCECCGKDFFEFMEEDEKEQGRKTCLACADDKIIGQRLVNAKLISFGFGADPHLENSVSFYDKIYLILKDKPSKDTSHFITYSLDPSRFDGNISKFYANYVPRVISDDSNIKMGNIDSSNTATFEDIAIMAEGTAHLGILKADVDRLGYIFSEGLGDATTISRVATLSNQLDLFFSGYLPQMIKKKFDSTYIVYSGGDDLLFVGPWDSIFKLSNYVSREFSRFTSFNKNISLSAGIAITGKKHPIWDGAKQAEKLLEKSKEGENGKGRNRLTIFDTTVEWSDFSLVDENAEMLNKALKAADIGEEGLSTSFVYSLLTFKKMYKEGNPLYKALLSYSTARNLKRKDDENNEESKLMQDVRDYLVKLTRREGEELMKNINIPVSYALLKNRQGGR